MLAKQFAMHILNTNKLNTCPDYRYINKLEEKKDIVVEQIRNDIVNNVLSKPISSSKKVYIIDDAHLMNANAQNALLKTLEEPPEYVVIILISSQKNAFLPTIKSRVKTIEFSNLSAEEINLFMEKNKIEKISENIIKYLDGSVSKLISLTDEDLKNYSNIIDLIKTIESRPIYEVLVNVKNINFKNIDYLNYLQYMLFSQYKSTNIFSYVNTVEIIEKAKNKLKCNGNYDIVIDNMLIMVYNEIRR